MSRTYEETHPWINFTVNLSRPDHELWLMLGEAQSKAQHVAGVPLLPAIQHSFFQMFLAKGVLATTAIEGNTLTEEEVRLHLEGKLKLPPSKEYLKQEIQNVIDACNSIGRKVLDGEPLRLTLSKLKEYNALVLRGLPGVEDVTPGEFRTYEVGVGRYKGAPWQDVEFLTTKLCDWINGDFRAPKGYEIAFGVIRAILAHLYIAWIHPFGDGNGRTARLVEFEILLSVGVPDVAAHLLSNHYNQTRTEYYRHLDISSRTSGGDPLPFMKYALLGFVDGLKEQVETIKTQQLIVHWINYIHEVFKNRDSAAFNRRRRLAVDMTFKDEAVPFSGIRHVSPRIAEAYAGKTDKTVRRDLNALESLGLVARTGEGYRLRFDKMLAFLPEVRSRE
jgi:Fic family protein